MHELRRAVESMTRASVIREEGNYLYAEYKSALMGYVDDVELLLDEKARLVHVRSASRLGTQRFRRQPQADRGAAQPHRKSTITGWWIRGAILRRRRGSSAAAAPGPCVTKT